MLIMKSNEKETIIQVNNVYYSFDDLNKACEAGTELDKIDNAKIQELRNNLAETDYKVIKAIEVKKDLSNEFIAKRQEWRDEINKLEKKLAKYDKYITNYEEPAEDSFIVPKIPREE